MDRSPLAREGRRSLLGAVGPVAVCILVVIWLCGFTAAILAAHGWEIFSPVAWMGQLSSGLPDDRLWIGRLFGIIAWLVLVVGAIALPLIVLILAGRRIAHRMRRWSRLRWFDPGAVPDLVVLLDDDDLFGHIAARSRRVALRGVLERLAPDTGLARALAGETRVWLLGDLDRMPGEVPRRLDGYLLDRRSRSSAVIAVDRAEDRCWLMARVVPQRAFDVEQLPGFRRADASVAGLAGSAVILTWAADAGAWSTSDGGWGDGGSGGGSGDGGSGDGGSGGGGGDSGGDGGGGGGGGGE